MSVKQSVSFALSACLLGLGGGCNGAVMHNTERGRYQAAPSTFPGHQFVVLDTDTGRCWAYTTVQVRNVVSGKWVPLGSPAWPDVPTVSAPCLAPPADLQFLAREKGASSKPSGRSAK